MLIAPDWSELTMTTTVTTSAADAESRGAIRGLVDAAVRHQNDVERFLALHTDGVVIVNIAGRRVVGIDALEDAMRAALESRLADVTTTVEIEDVRFLGDDVALVSATKHVHDRREDPTQALPEVGTMSYVVVREPDGWRIALAQTTPRQG